MSLIKRKVIRNKLTFFRKSTIEVEGTLYDTICGYFKCPERDSFDEFNPKSKICIECDKTPYTKRYGYLPIIDDSETKENQKKY